MSEAVQLTDHAIARLKERCGVKPKAAAAFAQRAYDEGLTHAGASGKLRRYLDRTYLTHQKGNRLRVYGRHVFIFQGPALITVLHLPHDLERAADDQRHKQQQQRANDEA